MRIGFAGDWHGNRQWAIAATQALIASGAQVIHHVGDFGLFRSSGIGDLVLPELLEPILAGSDITLYITPGNHEDWGWIYQNLSDREFAVTPHIRLVRPGDVVEHGGIRVLSVGGAPSIDCAYRHRVFRDWWPQEVIQPEEYHRALGQTGEFDVLVTHDVFLAHAPGVAAQIAGNPYRFTADDLAYANTQQGALQTLVEKVRPRIWVHGHYHLADYVEESPTGGATVSLGRDGDAAGNLWIWDRGTDERSFVRVDA